MTGTDLFARQLSLVQNIVILTSIIYGNFKGTDKATEKAAIAAPAVSVDACPENPRSEPQASDEEGACWALLHIRRLWWYHKCRREGHRLGAAMCSVEGFKFRRRSGWAVAELCVFMVLCAVACWMLLRTSVCCCQIPVTVSWWILEEGAGRCLERLQNCRLRLVGAVRFSGLVRSSALGPPHPTSVSRLRTAPLQPTKPPDDFQLVVMKYYDTLSHDLTLGKFIVQIIEDYKQRSESEYSGAGIRALHYAHNKVHMHCNA